MSERDRTKSAEDRVADTERELHDALKGLSSVRERCSEVVQQIEESDAPVTLEEEDGLVEDIERLHRRARNTNEIAARRVR